MTLGGLALAVGILVDDATVTIENINWHLEHGKDVTTAIMDGARQIVQPAFVSLLCICIVFVPMFALQGVAGYLFVPMAMSVVFAMIASFILSRTLVPTMAMYLLKPHPCATRRRTMPCTRPKAAMRWRRLQMKIRTRLRQRARELSQPAGAGDDAAGGLFVTGFLAVVALSFLLVPFLGSNFFPTVDAGQMQLACPPAHRHPHRGHAADLRPHRERCPQDHPAQRPGRHHRQYRPAAQLHQPHLYQFRHDRSPATAISSSA